MPERPEFLNQPTKLRDRDRELQQQLKAEAAARGVVMSQRERHVDFVERSITEVRRHLRKAPTKEERAHYRARLKFLLSEQQRQNA